MKIRVLYEDNIKNGHRNYAEIEIPDDGNYSVMLDIDYEQRLAEAKPENRSKVKRCDTVQEMFDIMNDKEFNNWRKHHRYIGNYNGQDYEDDGIEESSDSGSTWQEPLMDEVADDRIFRRDELEREEKYSYEATCDFVRAVCGRKQNWADAFIAVRLDGMSVNDFAASIGVSDASIVSKYLARAEKKLKENYPKRQI